MNQLWYNLLLFCLIFSLVANTQTDSTYNYFASQPNDTTSVFSILAESKKYYGTDLDKGLKYVDLALKMAQNLNYDKGTRQCYNTYGHHYLYVSQYSKSLENYLKCLEIDEKLNIKQKIADDCINIGIVYYYLGNRKSLEYYLKAVAIYEEIENPIDLAIAYNNICGYFTNIEKLDSAFFYGSKALSIFEKLEAEAEISDAQINLGNILKMQGNLKKALNFYQKAYNYYIQNEDLEKIASCNINIASTYSELNEPNSAFKKLNEAYSYFKQIGNKESQLICLTGFSQFHEKINNYKEALAYRDSISVLEKIIFDENSQKAIAEMETKYQTEKKDKENQLLKIDNDLQKETIARKQLFEYAMGGGILTLFIIVGLILHQFVQKKKANLLLTEQKNIISEKNEELNQFIEEIEAQRDQIDEQNKDLEHKNSHIMSSIQYAKRIQEAILPSDELVRNNLAESFVLYKPKDIVSGDFYWMESIGQKVFWAAVDCTGHGVPGAFMSILGANGLKKIVSERHIYQPAEILTHLTEHVISSIKETKDGEEVKDGMDISLCCWDKENNTLEWAGAYNPLFIVREAPIYNLAEKSNFHPFDPEKENLGGLYDVKATKRPIGRFKRKNIPDFENHTISLQQGDCIYVFTDGFADQFGGEDGSKYTTRKMREFVIKIYKKPMQEQILLLEQEFENWRGKEEQLDDICIFGVKV